LKPETSPTVVTVDSSEPVWHRNLPPKFRASPGGTSLKRAHPSNELALPVLSVELALAVFTHSSISHTANEEFGDSTRLAELGATVIRMIVTWSLFCKHPLLSAEDIQKQSEELLSDAMIDSWLTRYRLREKLRFSSDAVKVLNSPKVRTTFHLAYNIKCSLLLIRKDACL
jgi:dsRNA-specific ribonuclease